MSDTILEYAVSSEDAGKTVETIWRKKFEISASLFKELKLNGKLRINGTICKSVDRVSEGDLLTADVEERKQSENIVPIKMNLDIVYEDAYIMVLNKPRKMSVHPSMGNFDNTLANGIVWYWKKSGEAHKFHAVNRIDKDTTGVCVVAKNSFAHSALSNQLKDGRFKRKYIAVVHGEVVPKQGILELPIKRECDSVIKRIVAKDGKRAVTKYNVIKSDKKISVLDISLETGKTHQIRVHFSHIGHPLVGDWLYGNGDSEREIALGHLLHAYYAEFYHPKSGERLTFKLSLPKDMEAFI